MSEIADVVPGSDVESTWGNLIKDRTLQRYATQAVLDSSILTPVPGEIAYVVDESVAKIWTGAAWIVFALQVDGAFLPLSGGTMQQAINMGGFKLQEVDDIEFADSGTNFIHQVAGNELVFRIGSVNEMIIRQGQVRSPGGSAAAPGVAVGQDDLGWYRVGSNRIGAAGGGGTSIFEIGLSGGEVAITASPVWTLTTGTAANVFVDNTGGQFKLRRSTSAKRYKTNIKSLVTKTRTEFLDVDLRPVEFKHKGDQKEYVGFIADEVAELDPRLGDFNVDGEIENYDLRGVVAILAAQVNDLRARVKTLEAV